MQRFCMSEGFPNSRGEIEPYIDFNFILTSEGGNIIPLVSGFGCPEVLTDEAIGILEGIRIRGGEINGDVHPMFDRPINVSGDMEFYRPLSPSVASMLQRHGIKVVYNKN